jgi:hypothetical protein
VEIHFRRADGDDVFATTWDYSLSLRQKRPKKHPLRLGQRGVSILRACCTSLRKAIMLSTLDELSCDHHRVKGNLVLRAVACHGGCRVYQYDMLPTGVLLVRRR